MKKLNFLLSAIIFACLVNFVSCSDLTVDKNGDKLNSENSSFERNKAYISLSVNQNNARTVLPEETNISLADLSDFTLVGKIEGGTETVTFGSWATYSEMASSSKIGCEVGVWTFTLTAKLERLEYSSTIKQEIVLGQNYLSFELFSVGYGSVEVGLCFPNDKNVKAVKAGLFYTDTYDEASNFGLKLLEIQTSAQNLSVTYSAEQVPSGYYFVKFYLYKDSEATDLLNPQYYELVKVDGGKLSKAARTLSSLDEKFTITYVGCEGAEWAEGFEKIDSFNENESVILPSKYFDLKKDGYAFWGFYTDKTYKTKITGWNYGEKTENIVLYAKWVSLYYWNYPTSTPNLTWEGSGIENDPYLIVTAQQLADFAYMVNEEYKEYTDEYIALACDIDLNHGYSVKGENSSYKQWTPIEKNYYGFRGTFDGKNHTINGLYINSSSYWSAGLFGCVRGGTVKNLIMGTGYVSNTYNSVSGSGAIAGCLEQGSKIDCCGNENTIIVDNDDKDSYVGGLVGWIVGGSSAYFCIYNSYNKADVISNTSMFSAMAGGITGVGNVYVDIRNCYNTGNVTGYYVGGINGFAYSSEKNNYVYNSYSVGTLSGSQKGGIAGASDADYTTMRYCYYLASTASGHSNSGVSDTDAKYNGTFDSAASAISTTSGYNGTLLQCLNAWINAQNSSEYKRWVVGSDGWPTLDF